MSQLDLFRLDGRVALVPGGGGAIGSAMAAAFAGAGAHVAIVDQTDERAEAAAARSGPPARRSWPSAPTSRARPSASGSSPRPWSGSGGSTSS